MLPDGCAAIAALWYMSMLLLVSISDTVMHPAGADGGQLFVNKQHGALIWGMRLQELHADMAAKNDTWAPLGVVEGPTEPTRLDSIFSSLEDFFLAHDPGMPSTLTSSVSPTVGHVCCHASSCHWTALCLGAAGSHSYHRVHVPVGPHVCRPVDWVGML